MISSDRAFSVLTATASGMFSARVTRKSEVTSTGEMLAKNSWLSSRRSLKRSFNSSMEKSAYATTVTSSFPLLAGENFACLGASHVDLDQGAKTQTGEHGDAEPVDHPPAGAACP